MRQDRKKLFPKLNAPKRGCGACAGERLQQHQQPAVKLQASTSRLACRGLGLDQWRDKQQDINRSMRSSRPTALQTRDEKGWVGKRVHKLHRIDALIMHPLTGDTATAVVKGPDSSRFAAQWRTAQWADTKTAEHPTLCDWRGRAIAGPAKHPFWVRQTDNPKCLAHKCTSLDSGCTGHLAFSETPIFIKTALT